VEVSPPFDHAEVTAFLGNRVVLEALSGIAWRRRQLAGSPSGGRTRRCSRGAEAAWALTWPDEPSRGPE